MNSEYEGGGTWELGQEEWGGNYNNSALFVLRSPSKDPEDLYGTDVGDKSFEGAHPYRTLE